jgi:hypothetical protein
MQCTQGSRYGTRATTAASGATHRRTLRRALSRSSLCFGFGEQLIYDLLDLSLSFETLHRSE